MSDLLTLLDRCGDAMPRWVASMTAWTAVLLGVAWLLDRVVARRVAARWRVLLFVAVLARVALPVGWRSPLAVFGRDQPPPTAVLAVTTAPTPLPHAPAMPVAAPLLPPETTAGRWFVVAWLAGASAILATGFVARRRLNRALAFAREASPRIALLAPSCRVAEHASLGPMVVGLLRPTIVLPTVLIASLDPREVAHVLRHESAHVARRDPVIAALLQLACALAWPIIPVWLASRRVRTLVEVACDDVALRGAASDDRRAYGRTLLRVAAWRPVRRPFALAAGSLGFGNGLAERVTALRFTRRWPSLAQAAVVLSASGVALLTLGAAAPDSSREQAASFSLDATPAAPSAPDPTLDAQGFPTLSPFQAIRWRDDVAEVTVGATWYELAAIDGVAARDIVAFCHATYGENWKKRFEEDLVAVMTRMGHPPGDRVALTLARLGDHANVTLPDVPMTHENRQAIWRAANARRE